MSTTPESRLHSSPGTFSVLRRTIRHPIHMATGIIEGPLIRNAISLYGTTIITSLLGFIYWFLAAHMVPASAVGTASAIQSAAQFLSIVCVLGLSTLLISELSSDRSGARSLILTAATVAGGFSLFVSILAGIGLVANASLKGGLQGPTNLAIFATLCALTTILLVMDDACIGLLRGDLQFQRNSVFAVSKLLILPVLIVVWPARSGVELVVAWELGLAISLVTLSRKLAKITEGSPWRLNFRHLYERRKLMVGHHWLNISVQSPRLIIPVVVIAVLGAVANAAFTAAALVVSFVNIIPVHLSTVLFALSPGDEVALHREVRKTMRICLILALISAPVFALLSHFILGLFGPSYEVASKALAVLGLTTYPLAIKSHYVAIARVRGKMHQAAFRTMVGASLEIGLAAAGAEHFGVTGVAVGFLIATVLEALIFAPVVVGVLRRESAAR